MTKVGAAAVAAAILGVCLTMLHSACSSADADLSVPVSDAAKEDRFVDANSADARADVSSSAAFLDDPALWSPVVNDIGCRILEGRVVPDPFPRRAWASCGRGCRVGPGALPIESIGGVTATSSSAVYLQDDVYLSFVTGFLGRGYVQHVTRLSDDATVAAVQLPVGADRCVFAGMGTDAPLLFTPFVIRDGAARWSFGRASKTPGAPVLWQSNSVVESEHPLYRFMFNGGHGITLQSGRIAFLNSVQSTAFSYPNVGPGLLLASAARGDLLVLGGREADAGSLIRVDGDASPLLLARASNEVPIALSLDEQQLAWVAATVDMDKVHSGLYPATTLRWATLVGGVLATTVSSAVLAAAPSAGYTTLRVAGDFAATVTCAPPSSTEPDPQCTLLVVQLSTKQVRSVPHRPGANMFTQVLAVSPSEVLITEIDYPPRGDTNAISRIVRLDLAALDALGW